MKIDKYYSWVVFQLKKRHWLVMSLFGLAIVTIEAVEHISVQESIFTSHFLTEVVVYGISIPILGAFLLNWVDKVDVDRQAALSELTQIHQFSDQLRNASTWDDLTSLIIKLPVTSCSLLINNPDHDMMEFVSTWRANENHQVDPELVMNLEQCQSWTTSFSTSMVNLNPSTSTTFTVMVEIPPDANDQETDSVTITATSQGDISKTDTAVLTTTSISTPFYGVALSADDSLPGPVGGQISYILTITNTGNIADDYNLAPSGHTWTTTLSNSQLHLAPSASGIITVTVGIPPDANDQDTDSVTITATSQGDTSKTDTAVLTTTSIATPIYGVTLSADDSLSGPAGDLVSYTMAITNTGNVFDTFDLMLSGEEWIANLSTSSASLSPSASKLFTVTINIPPGSNNQDTDSVTVTATSQGDINKTDGAVLTTISLGKSIKIYLPVVFLNSTQ